MEQPSATDPLQQPSDQSYSATSSDSGGAERGVSLLPFALSLIAVLLLTIAGCFLPFARGVYRDPQVDPRWQPFNEVNGVGVLTQGTTEVRLPTFIGFDSLTTALQQPGFFIIAFAVVGIVAALSICVGKANRIWIPVSCVSSALMGAVALISISNTEGLLPSWAQYETMSAGAGSILVLILSIAAIGLSVTIVSKRISL